MASVVYLLVVFIESDLSCLWNVYPIWYMKACLIVYSFFVSCRSTKYLKLQFLWIDLHYVGASKFTVHGLCNVVKQIKQVRISSHFIPCQVNFIFSLLRKRLPVPNDTHLFKGFSCIILDFFDDMNTWYPKLGHGTWTGAIPWYRPTSSPVTPRPTG